MASENELILVYGATGAQGGPVARRLLEEGRRIRILTRDPGKAESLREAGAEIALGDLENPESLEAASKGADKVFFHVPLGFILDVGTAYGRNAIDAAVSAGIGLFVFDTNFPLPSEPTDVVVTEIRRVVQAYLQGSGIAHIIIRPTFYIENYSGPFTAPEDIVQQGILRYLPEPYRDVRVSWISIEDVAALAVEALRRPELADSVFDVGGPEALTPDEIAERFAAILDRPVNYDPFSLDQYKQLVNTFLGEPVGTHLARQLRYYVEHSHLLNVSDMQPVLRELPVHLTTFERCISKMPLFTTGQAGA